MNSKLTSWLLFGVLCTVWGSSFILMKLGLYATGSVPVLSPFQVAALRIFSAGIVLIPFVFGAAKRIPRKSLGFILLSGLFGNFFPAFLFCIAESRIDSALTAMLNTLTPIFALLLGLLLYKSKVGVYQWLGVITGFIGCVLLFEGKSSMQSGDLWFAAMVILAAICYGVNVNMVRHKLSHLASLDIAAMAFSMLLLPSFAVLLVTGFFHLSFTEPAFEVAVSATSALGIIGTALATVAFYRLVKLGGPVFASMVTYGIPFVAIVWGLLYGEKVTGIQVAGLVIILGGVYIAGRKPRA